MFRACDDDHISASTRRHNTFLSPWAVPSSTVTCALPMMLGIPKLSWMAERFMETVPSAPWWKGTTWAATFLSFSLPALGISVFSPVPFLRCSYSKMTQRRSASNRGRITVMSGRFHSKRFSVKIVHTNFTRSFLTTERDECSYHCSAQAKLPA